MATTFRLKPDGAFTVIHLHPSVSLEGSLLAFGDEVVSSFAALAQEIYVGFTDPERREIERLAAAKDEIGAAYGASSEELAITVPSDRVVEAKRRIEALFDDIGEVLIEV
ncbi:MAG TPA: hypothetical protein VFL80_06480 [Thermoanaerobaculia bacterium]|nr:hypothetical protein [Thermoanaerobaculia bacterium]